MASQNALANLFKPFVKRVNEGLKVLLDGRKPEKLYSYIGYQLGLQDEELSPCVAFKGGKRLRSSIPLLVAKYLGEGEFALPGSLALELFHNFTLIVDDIQDHDEIRHARPTLWKLVGVPQALNAALVAEALAHDCAKDACAHLPPKTASNWLLAFQQMTMKVFEGQHLDILYEREEQVFTAQYLQMAFSKTGILLGQSFAQGFALQPREEIRKIAIIMRQVGEMAGMAFQVQDDILGLWSDTKKTGKPVGSDLHRHKKTLPIVHALENGSRSTRQVILEAFKGELDDKKVNSILGCLEAAGSKDYALSQVREYSSRALALLDGSAIDDKLKSKLAEVIENLSKRET